MTKHNYYSHASFIAALYFGCFAVMFNILASYFLFILKTGIFLPFFSSSLLALILGSMFGKFYGKRIAVASKPSHAFLWGLLLATSMIPFYSLGLQVIYYFHHHALYNNIHQWQDYLVIYGVIILFFLLIAGIWLILLTGLAALHFNKYFFPGYNAYLRKQKSSLKTSVDADDK